MGLLSSSKSNSNSTTNISDERIGATDNATVVGRGANLGINLQQVDFNAVTGGLGTAQHAITYMGYAVDNVRDLAEKSAIANQRAAEAAAAAALQASKIAIESNEKVSKAALDSNVEVVDMSYDYGTDVYKRTIDYVGNINQQALSVIDTSNSAITNAFNDALKAVEQAKKSEVSASFDNMIKYLGLAVGALVVLAIIRRGGK